MKKKTQQPGPESPELGSQALDNLADVLGAVAPSDTRPPETADPEGLPTPITEDIGSPVAAEDASELLTAGPNEETLQDHLQGLRAGLPDPGLVDDRQIRSWLEAEGGATKDSNEKALLAGWVLASREQGIPHGQKTAWLDEQAKALGRSIRTLQMYMQVATELEAISATPLRISILERPLREIPSLIRQATGAAKAKPKVTPSTPSALAERWAAKFKRLVEEAEFDAQLREAILPELERAARSLKRRPSPGGGDGTASGHDDRTVGVRKQDLSAALKQLRACRPKGHMTLRVEERGESGRVALSVANKGAAVTVSMPAMVGQRAPDEMVVPVGAVRKLATVPRTRTGLLEFQQFEGAEVKVLLGSGVIPMPPVVGASPHVRPQATTPDVSWMPQDLATVLRAGLSVQRMGGTAFHLKGAVAVFGAGVGAAVLGDKGLRLFAISNPTAPSAAISNEWARTLLAMLETANAVELHTSSSRIIARGSSSLTAEVPVTVHDPLPAISLPETQGLGLVAPAARLRGALEATRPGVAGAPVALSLDSGRSVLTVSRTATGSGKAATWELRVALPEGRDAWPKWPLVQVHHGMLEGAVVAWPHHWIELETHEQDSKLSLRVPGGEGTKLGIVVRCEK
jgi:hypothetical protein